MPVVEGDEICNTTGPLHVLYNYILLLTRGSSICELRYTRTQHVNNRKVNFYPDGEIVTAHDVVNRIRLAIYANDHIIKNII